MRVLTEEINAECPILKNNNVLNAISVLEDKTGLILQKGGADDSHFIIIDPCSSLRFFPFFKSNGKWGWRSIDCWDVKENVETNIEFTYLNRLSDTLNNTEETL